MDTQQPESQFPSDVDPSFAPGAERFNFADAVEQVPHRAFEGPSFDDPDQQTTLTTEAAVSPAELAQEQAVLLRFFGREVKHNRNRVQGRHYDQAA